MNELINHDTITSLELVEEINKFREQEKNRAKLLHKTLLEIIRDEFEEEINEQKILPVEYKDKKGELRPMYVLTLNQAKQILIRESKFVRRAIIHYIEKLEDNLKKNQIKGEKERLLLEIQKTSEIINDVFKIDILKDVEYNKLIEFQKNLEKNFSEIQGKYEKDINEYIRNISIEFDKIHNLPQENNFYLIKKDDLLNIMSKYQEIRYMNLFCGKINKKF